MTKRTNAFQKAILFIHQQLKDSGTVVRESALLRETNIDRPVEREVDVLIEKVDNGVTKRIAIECRDRLAKDDIVWIDGLIGKYLNLGVDRVIAVSSSGFSKSAELKATASGIELRTTNEIRNIDWDKEFIKIGIADLRIDFKIHKISAETERGVLILPRPDDKVIYKDDEGTFNEFVQVFRKAQWDKVFKAKFNQSISEIYKTKEDLSKFANIEHRVPIPIIRLISGDSDYAIQALIMHMVGVPVVRDLSTRHFDYAGSVISKTEMKVNANQTLTFITAQAESNRKLSVTVDKRSLKRKK